jgi:hypothetical protein
LSQAGIAERVQHEMGRPLHYEELLVSPDPIALRVVDDAARALGRRDGLPK